MVLKIALAHSLNLAQISLVNSNGKVKLFAPKGPLMKARSSFTWLHKLMTLTKPLLRINTQLKLVSTSKRKLLARRLKMPL